MEYSRSLSSYDVSQLMATNFFGAYATDTLHSVSTEALHEALL